jgi:hypothetical protein
VSEMWSAIELIGTRPATVEAVESDGNVISQGTIEVLGPEGHAEIHAVRISEPSEGIEPACSQVSRRLTPTGLRWEYPHREHLMRCAECLRLYPLPD